MDSDWTRWAKKHGLEIKLTPLRIDKIEESTVNGAYIFKKESNRIHFFLNHWSAWIVKDLKEELPVNKLD